MSDNLKLWKSVEKTNPNYTKRANVKGNNITSISPQYQILNATEKFGVYGVTWGFKDIKIDYTLIPVCGLIYWTADFYYPNGGFPATNSISIWRDNAMTKADDQFAKKVETDSLTKCLSKLGFNADIFLGRFEDSRYMNELNEEFKSDEQKASEAKRDAYLAEQKKKATQVKPQQIPQANPTVILKELTLEGFYFLTSDKASKDQVKEALDERRMTDSQRSSLIEVIEGRYTGNI